MARTALALFFPLLLYSYLPLRSLAAPVVFWNPVDSVQAFLVHVTARQYHGLWGSQGLRLSELGRFVTRQLPSEATLLLVALAAVGLVTMVRRAPQLALVCGLTLVLLVGYNLGYPIHDLALYYIPVLAILGLCAGVGAASMARAVNRLHRRAGAGVAAMLALGAALPRTMSWRANDRHDARLIACAVRDTLTVRRTMPSPGPDSWPGCGGPWWRRRWRQRSTFVTSDLYKHAMIAGFLLVPEGLAARVETRDAIRLLPLDAIAGPCGRRQDLRGPEEELIWDDYRVAFLNRAQVLRRHGLDEEAAAYAGRAVELTQ
jgi:hypothetical protein